MAAIMKISKFNIVPATKKHTATLFFFHGSGKKDLYLLNKIIKDRKKYIMKKRLHNEIFLNKY